MTGDNKDTTKINVVINKKSSEKPASPDEQKSSDTKPTEQNRHDGAKKEVNGFENKPEPTRYGDWEIGGRCFDF